MCDRWVDEPPDLSVDGHAGEWKNAQAGRRVGRIRQDGLRTWGQGREASHHKAPAMIKAPAQDDCAPPAEQFVQ